jgi:hypothetical protein
MPCELALQVVEVIFYIQIMRKFIVFFALAFSFSLLSCGLHGFDDLSDSRIAEALQEALFLGSKTAADNLGTSCVSSLGECTTGYLGNKLVEIALPDTIKDVLDKIDSFTEKFNALPSAITSVMNLNSFLLKSSAITGSSITLENSANIQSISLSDFSNLRGLGGRIKDTLNRGAERAAPKSVKLFENAIFGMSFSDARSILFGNVDTAATSYLREMTFIGLQGIFSGILKSCLNELKLNNIWDPIATSYNSFAGFYLEAIVSTDVKNAVNAYNSFNSNKVSLPDLPYNKLGKDLSGDLSEYATGKALDGLFLMVGKQESKLRADPWGTVKAVGSFITDTVGDLLGDVFSKAIKEG